MLEYMMTRMVRKENGGHHHIVISTIRTPILSGVSANPLEYDVTVYEEPRDRPARDFGDYVTGDYSERGSFGTSLHLAAVNSFRSQRYKPTETEYTRR